MKKLGLMALLIAAAAGPALAVQSIGIYEDAAGLDCEIADPGGGVMKTIYIVHTIDVQPTVGSSWTLEWDPGMTMVFVDDSSLYYKVGNARDGVQLSYYTCQSGTLLIDSVTMLSSGTSTPCSHFRLGPHPTQGRVIVYCNFSYGLFDAHDAIVNGNGTCSCSVGIEATTWGSVKALYR